MSQFNNISKALLQRYLGVLSPAAGGRVHLPVDLNEALNATLVGPLQGHLRSTLENIAAKPDSKLLLSEEIGEHGTKELVALEENGPGSYQPAREIESLADWFSLPSLLRKLADHVETNVVKPLRTTLSELSSTARDTSSSEAKFETGALAHQLLTKLTDLFPAKKEAPIATVTSY